MDLKLKKPDLVLESQKTQQGYNLFLEILLFLGIFFLSQMVIGILANIPVIIYMYFSGIMEELAGGSLDFLSLQEKIMVPSLLSMLYAELPGIFVVTLLCLGIQKRKMRTLGFKKEGMGKEYGIGMAAGFAMMTLVVLIAWACGSLHLHFNKDSLTFGSLGMLLLIFLGFLFQGMFEEVLCRGYFLISLARRKGNLWMAIWVSSLTFAALHLLNPGITLLSLVNLTLFGIFAGIYFLKRGSLWGIGALHALWNFTQGNVWGVLVSGNSFGISLFTADVEESMSLLNGGSFGLEGGLITTCLLIVSTLIVLRLPQKDAAPPDSEDPAPME